MYNTLALNSHFSEANTETGVGSVTCSRFKSWWAPEPGLPSCLTFSSGNWLHGCLEVFKSMWALGRKWEDALCRAMSAIHSRGQADTLELRGCPVMQPSSLCQGLPVRSSLKRHKKSVIWLRKRHWGSKLLLHHECNKAVKWVEIILFWLYAWGLCSKFKVQAAFFFGLFLPLATLPCVQTVQLVCAWGTLNLTFHISPGKIESGRNSSAKRITHHCQIETIFVYLLFPYLHQDWLIIILYNLTILPKMIGKKWTEISFVFSFLFLQICTDSFSLKGKRLDFYGEGETYVSLANTMPELSRLTACIDLISMTDSSHHWMAFSYITNNTLLGREGIDLGLAGDQEQLILYNFGKIFYLRYRLTPFHWHTMCLTWDGVKGRLELFRNKERIFAIMDQPHSLPSDGTLVLGHFPRNGESPIKTVVPRFTGSLYYFQLWDRILENEEFMTCLYGNVVSWEDDVWLMHKISPTVDRRLRCCE